MKIINSQFYRKIDNADQGSVAKAFIQRALGCAAENNKEYKKHYPGSEQTVSQCLDKTPLRAVAE